MSTFLTTLAALALSLSFAPADQTGSLSARADRMQPELLISILPDASLESELATPAGIIEHKSEVSRSGPIAAVIRTKNCEKDAAGACQVHADVVVYKPDGSIHQQMKAVDLPSGRGSIALTFDAAAPAGVYRVVATIRDMTARRFGSVEQKFGLK